MSRTLGLIAGLTVPAGLYYISVLHLQGTTNHISQALHEQSLRLEDPTKSPPVIFEPRDHDSFAARVRQGWNGGIERGVRVIQETDWEATAKTTATAISNLARAGWTKLEPKVEEGREKLSDLSESTKDGALHAGEAVGSAIHDGRIKAEQLAHEANLKSRRLAHDASVEAQRLSRVARDDAIEAKEILKDAERRAEIEYEKRKVQAKQKSAELGEETKRQAQEAKKAVQAASSVVSSKLHDMKETASAMLSQTKESAAQAKDSVKHAAHGTERRAEASLLSTQLRASEAWILAQDRYEQLLTQSERASSMKFKELEEAFGARRIGFSRVDDPTTAAKNVADAEKYNLKKAAPVKLERRQSMQVAELLETTADF